MSFLLWADKWYKKLMANNTVEKKNWKKNVVTLLYFYLLFIINLFQNSFHPANKTSTSTTSSTLCTGPQRHPSSPDERRHGQGKKSSWDPESHSSLDGDGRPGPAGSSTGPGRGQHETGWECSCRGQATGWPGIKVSAWSWRCFSSELINHLKQFNCIGCVGWWHSRE